MEDINGLLSVFTNGQNIVGLIFALIVYFTIFIQRLQTGKKRDGDTEELKQEISDIKAEIKELKKQVIENEMMISAMNDIRKKKK